MAITDKILVEWGGETLMTDFDDQSGSWIIIAIHSTKRGPAAGGTRMKHYPSFDAAVRDALNLSKAMTRKFSTVDMNWGGGKSVISIPSSLSGECRRNLLLRFGTLIKGLAGKYYAGPDIGTSSEDMDLLYEVCGPYVFSRTEEQGGAGSSAVPTALGVFAGIETSCEHVFGSKVLLGRKVLVQGTGSVGGILLKMLNDAGAKVLFSETNQELIQRFMAEGYDFVDPSVALQTECDILAPCANGAILDSETIRKLKCKAVVGAANNQLADEISALLLHERGILYAPDFVVNLGGAMGITAIEAEGLSRGESFEKVRQSISTALRAIYKRAAQNNTSTLDAADDLAEVNLGKLTATENQVN